MGIVVVVVLTYTHRYNAVRGHRTGSDNSGAEDYPRPFLTRNIFDKYLGCLGPKKLSKIFLENIIWEIWEASYGSEIFFSLFDGGM